MTTVTRFAPSPTGRLHLGHAYAALFAAKRARRDGGRFLLRIEDIDATRCRREFIDAILEDLDWLGLAWERPVRRQSEHMDDYRAALERLEAMGVLYPCFCTRKDIAAEIARAGGAPHGPDGAIYPGICRGLDAPTREARRAAGTAYALRLDVVRALAITGPLTWRDEAAGEIAADPLSLGDVVLARKETPTSYHLAVTLDDHLQGVTTVTRGTDLFHATHVHRLLQALLGLDVPRWHHHRLLRDANGERLAKRAGAPTLQLLRARGTDPVALRRELGFE
jgi:glutamyl-Q tRNA(Asp) synthetase